MNKKDLKFYEAPACEVVELKTQSVLLAGSDTEIPGNSEDTPVEGNTGEI